VSSRLGCSRLCRGLGGGGRARRRGRRGGRRGSVGGLVGEMGGEREGEWGKGEGNGGMYVVDVG